jgi:hypothetical protein
MTAVTVAGVVVRSRADGTAVARDAYIAAVAGDDRYTVPSESATITDAWRSR